MGVESLLLEGDDEEAEPESEPEPEPEPEPDPEELLGEAPFWEIEDAEVSPVLEEKLAVVVGELV